MDPINFQPAAINNRFNPVQPVDLSQGMQQEATRQLNAQRSLLSDMDRNASVVQKNLNQQQKDLENISQFSSSLFDNLIKTKKANDQQIRKEAFVEGLNTPVQIPQDYLDTEQEAIKQNSESQAVGFALGKLDYEAAIPFTQGTTWAEVGRMEGKAVKTIEQIAPFIEEAQKQENFEVPAEYNAWLDRTIGEFSEKVGLTNLNPYFLEKSIYPKIRDIKKTLSRRYREGWIQRDNGKQLLEIDANHAATQNIPSTIQRLANTVDSNGQQVGYAKAWGLYDKMIQDGIQGGLYNYSDIVSLGSQVVPKGQPGEGKLYAEFYATRFGLYFETLARRDNVTKQRRDAQKTEELKAFENELIEKIQKEIEKGDLSQAELDAAQKEYLTFSDGQTSQRIDNFGKVTTNQEQRNEQKTDIEKRLAEGTMTQELFNRYDPNVSAQYQNQWNQRQQFFKENNNFKSELDLIKIAVVSDDAISATPEGEAQSVSAKKYIKAMQDKFVKLVEMNRLGEVPDPVTNAQNQILKEIKDYLDKPGNIYNGLAPTALGGTRRVGPGEIKGYEFVQPFETATGVKEIYQSLSAGKKSLDKSGEYYSVPELEVVFKDITKLGWSPNYKTKIIAKELGVSPIEVLQRQYRATFDMELPSPPMQIIVDEVSPDFKDYLYRTRTEHAEIRALGSLTPPMSELSDEPGNYGYKEGDVVGGDDVDPDAKGQGGGGFKAELIPYGYGQAVVDAAKEHNIHPSLLSGLIWQESKWQKTAVSYVGAKGLGQFMPATAKEFGVNVNDPVSSINGAAKYLRYLIDHFNGDERLAIFAYNGGMGNIEYYNGPIPDNVENQQYYDKVMTGAYKYGYGNLQQKMRPTLGN